MMCDITSYRMVSVAVDTVLRFSTGILSIFLAHLINSQPPSLGAPAPGLLCREIGGLSHEDSFVSPFLERPACRQSRLAHCQHLGSESEALCKTMTS